MTASRTLPRLTAGGTLAGVTTRDDTEANLAGELARVRHSVRRRLAASVGVTAALAVASAVLLVAADRSGRWADELRRDGDPTTVPALLVAHPRTGHRTSGASYSLLLTLPGRFVTIDRVDADPYLGRATVQAWIDPGHPDRVATTWDATDASHRSLLTAGATVGLVLTLFAVWRLRTAALIAWAARRNGLRSGYVVDVRSEGGDLTPTAPRSLVLVHGEDEPYSAGVWQQPPAPGWATMSGPARWRVLASWGRRPTLVHRGWLPAAAQWRRTFRQP